MSLTSPTFTNPGSVPRIRSSRVLPDRPDPAMYTTVGRVATTRPAPLRCCVGRFTVARIPSGLTAIGTTPPSGAAGIRRSGSPASGLGHVSLVPMTGPAPPCCARTFTRADRRFGPVLLEDIDAVPSGRAKRQHRRPSGTFSPRPAQPAQLAAPQALATSSSTIPPTRATAAATRSSAAPGCAPPTSVRLSGSRRAASSSRQFIALLTQHDQSFVGEPPGESQLMAIHVLAEPVVTRNNQRTFAVAAGLDDRRGSP